jgi:hypothetical protein
VSELEAARAAIKTNMERREIARLRLEAHLKKGIAT